MERHLPVMDTKKGCWIATVKEQTLTPKQAKIAHLFIQLLLLLFTDKMVCEVQPGRGDQGKSLIEEEHQANSNYLAIYIWEKFGGCVFRAC